MKNAPTVHSPSSPLVTRRAYPHIHIIRKSNNSASRNTNIRTSYIKYTLKRSIDYACTVFSLLILSPLMLLIALLIRLESNGPIFFRQQRMGKDGQLFWIWKFRTMVPDAEQRLKDLEHLNESRGGVLFKIKDDPRVTPLGRFLRRTSLDELPQLFNVLQGQMSLVGPRPLPLRDCDRLRKESETSLARRLEVLPGVTGLWQVSGRSRLGADRMIQLDCYYIDRWSLWLDLQIIVRTLTVLLDKGGAY